MSLHGRALVAQGIERLPPEQKAVGSNPIEGTTKGPVDLVGGAFLAMRGNDFSEAVFTPYASDRLPASILQAVFGPGSRR